MEIFYEESLSKKDMRYNQLLYKFYFMLMISFGFVAVFMFSFVELFGNVYVALFMAVFFVIMSAACYFLKDKQIIEYDYTLLNNTFTISKIINNKKRKELISVDVNEFNSFGTIDDGNYERVKNNRTIIKAYLNNDEKHYYAVFNKENKNIILIFEPSIKMIDSINKANRMIKR